MRGPYTNEERESARELGKTHTLLQVSKITGIAHGTLDIWRQRYGLEFYSRQHPPEKHAEAREKAPSCSTWVELGRMTGVSGQTLRGWAEAEGWWIGGFAHTGGCDRCSHPRRHECNGTTICYCCDDALELPEPDEMDLSILEPANCYWWETMQPSPLVQAVGLASAA